MTVWSEELRTQVSEMIRKGCDSRTICEAINVSKSSLLTANKRHGLGTISRAGMVPPDDLVEQWPLMSQRELAVHNNVSHSTIAKWGDRLGLPRKVPNIEKARTARKPSRKARASYNAHNTVSPFDTEIRRDLSEAGICADYLRRFGPVIRCQPSGKDDPNGTHWRRSSFIYDAAGIVQRAAEVRQIEAYRASGAMR